MESAHIAMTMHAIATAISARLAKMESKAMRLNVIIADTKLTQVS
jgi:hypothetical protein